MKKSIQVFEDQRGNQLEYCLYGEGERYLLCFPGFGETHESFKQLAENLSDYTLVGINLYFIGESKRNVDDRYLDHKEWHATCQGLLDALHIKRFSVLGYSLGGRFAISTLLGFGDRVDHLLLVAADGLQTRFTYQLATFPFVMRSVFLYLMKNPSVFLGVVSLFEKLNLINPFTAKFAKSQLEQEEDRMRVYHSWVTFKHLKLSKNELVKLLNAASCSVTLIFGEKDKIIGPKTHLMLLNRLTQCEVLVLPFGHNKLVNNATKEIVRVLEKGE